jgi:hypothetical protein
VSGVEFLPEDGADEPPDLEPPHRTRPWWILGVLVLVVAALVWAISHPSDQPQPTSHAIATPTPISHPIGTVTATDRATQACHGAPFCAASVRIPADLRRVIRHYLPEVQSMQVRTYIGQALTSGTSYLADRDINALAGSVNVLISLHRNYQTSSRPSAIVVAPAGVGSMVVHSVTTAYTIDLQYLAPETVPPSRARLQMLTLDPRLESL